MSITARQLEWAAGIMEGEGYFGIRRGKDLTIQLTMTDKDVVDKFAAIFNFGSKKERKLPSGKVAYSWTSTNQRQTAGLMMTLLTLMGKRRAEKIVMCLQAWKEKRLPNKMQSTCKHGHLLEGDNLKITHEGKYTKRRCIECGKLRQRKYRIQQSASGIFAL